MNKKDVEMKIGELDRALDMLDWTIKEAFLEIEKFKGDIADFKEKLDEVDKGMALKVSAEDIASAIYSGVKAGSSIDISANSIVSITKEGVNVGKISMTPEGYSVGIKTAMDLKKPFDIYQARLDIAERLHKKIMSGKYDYDELQLFIDLTDGM